ncbi:MAG: hypothetical protein JEY96_19955 [Bacteroidales bacterium]|nr:hypothetical protein [Bacteroidales bacterium]
MDEIEKKQIINSTIKSLIGALPSAGTALNEVIFEYRSQVKQKRINKFIDLLKEYFEEIDETKIDFEHLKSEDFGDIFESILKRVTLNNSDKKLIRLKNVLLSHFNKEFNYVEQTENFLDLIGRISETELLILKYHDGLDSSFNEFSGRISRLRSEISKNENLLLKEKELLDKGRANYSSKFEKLLVEQNKELYELEDLLNNYQKQRKAEFYNLSDSQYAIMKHSLLSKGLLYDVGQGQFDFKPMKTLGITEYGIEFLNFIKERKI